MTDTPHAAPSAPPSNPIGQHNGTWGFWNETWTEWHGGYETENQARTALNEYAKSL